MSQPDILTQDVQHVPIDRVRAHPANPREGDVGAIWESIQENGFFGALVVQESSGCILAGNHRWMAAKEAGMQEVPVIYVDVDDERAMRILLADNRTNDVASYDGETLADLLEHLESTDDGLAGTGYDGDALDELLHDLGRDKPGAPLDDEGAETDRAEELREEWQTERGQLWQIGGHRLLCGDATDEGDVERLLDGAEPRLMVTDPPYGMDAVASSGVLRKRYNDVEGDENTDVAREAIRLARHLSCEAQVWWGANYYADELPPSSQWLVWDKNNGASDQMDAELAWTSLEGVTRRFEMASERGEGRHHPTQKPAELARWCIQQCGEGDVLDLFAGAGWTIIAAENEGRTCYAMEIDPGYCAVILERCSKAGLECELIDPAA